MHFSDDARIQISRRLREKSEKTLYIARILNHAPFRKIVVTLQRFRDNLDKIFETRRNVLREKRQTNRTVEKFDVLRVKRRNDSTIV